MASFVRLAARRHTLLGLDGNSPVRPSYHGLIEKKERSAPRRKMSVDLDKYIIKLLIRKGLHNFAHPRTDPVVIMAVIDEAGEKILLGRNVWSIINALHCLLDGN